MRPYLFGSRRVDLLAFGGTALLSVVLAAGLTAAGIVETPPWLWLLLVVGVDVAHVWSTLFRTYLDRAELARRSLLYTLAPAGCYLAGVLAYQSSATTFWRLLAYVAAFHFVRQQRGFLALYHRAAASPPETRHAPETHDAPKRTPGDPKDSDPPPSSGEHVFVPTKPTTVAGFVGTNPDQQRVPERVAQRPGHLSLHRVEQQGRTLGSGGPEPRSVLDLAGIDAKLDVAAIYAATLGPLVYWHARLPRGFAWFVEGDFAPIPHGFGVAALAISGTLLAAWGLKQFARGWAFGPQLLIPATAVVWFSGIVVFDNDVAFTATNILLHGVPYFLLLYRYGAKRASGEGYGVARAVLARGVAPFLALLIGLGLIEEMSWDALVWHEHLGLLGLPALDASEWLPFLVPLLALPQATHYVLDAFIWRPSREPALADRLGLSAQPQLAQMPNPSAQTPTA